MDLRGWALTLTVALLGAACGDDAPSPGPSDAGSVDVPATDVGAVDSGPVDTGTPDLGPQRPEVLARLETYLLGDFDNQAQFDGGFPQLVERHVCSAPGFPEDPEVLWLYVEHLERVAEGRDAYFIRINEIRVVEGRPVSRAYRFPTGHPLRTNAFTFNGPRDACFDASLFGPIGPAELEYREGCDVTFTPDGDRFSAVSPEMTCTFPGGWIQTLSTVFMDGLDSTDRAVTSGGESGSTFEFRRVDDFQPPGG